MTSTLPFRAAAIVPALLAVGCTADVSINTNATPALGPDVSECRKTVFLHIADYSWVPPLDTVAGVHKNSCWGYELRSDGFACEYAASQADRVDTADGGGPFASYDEITPPHLYDATAVANCASQSGRPVRTYAGNAPHWNQHGIPANVKFAELYTQENEADPYYDIWSSSYRGAFRPMINLGPDTGVDAYDTYTKTKRICDAVSDGQWIGIYFYDPSAVGGAGMSDWKALEILYALDACTAM
jgi:hypothetical protein